MLTIQQIMAEVDALVPNPFDTTKKIAWLNELNREFFEIVKIPVTYHFSTTPGRNITLPSDVRSRNIVRVQVDGTLYLSLQHDVVNPGHNYWVYDDVTKTFTLEPNPTIAGKIGFVNYHKTSTKTLLANDTPEAPEEYHFAYVLGLCERVAKGMNDVSLANNYGNDYRAQLAIAQQNYGYREG